jgi:RimJ/RimL family protein N-acetyltransferase
MRDNENGTSIESDTNLQTSGVVLGLVDLHSCITYGIPFLDHLTVPKTASDVPGDTLIIELGYQFLPIAWNKGYCTEAVQAMLKAYGGATEYFKPYKRFYVHMVVGEANPPSLRVAEKIGIRRLGVHEWNGDPMFLAGHWRDCRVGCF